MDGGEISQAYQEHRPYLVDLAFRMLGDIGAAEDVVQDAFSRLLRTAPGEIADERGWLIVVTSRLCLDQIRSARSRRERAHDATEIEFVAPPAAAGLADPADRVTLDDSVRLALLVVLQRLTPAERVVFVLHDVFQMPFGTIAETVVIPLTFGSRSDWAQNVWAAGGCSIRLRGRDYRATQPEFRTVADAGPLLRAAFSPVERASFRLLGIKQVVRLRIAPPGPGPA